MINKMNLKQQKVGIKIEIKELEKGKLTRLMNKRTSSFKKMDKFLTNRIKNGQRREHR